MMSENLHRLGSYSSLQSAVQNQLSCVFIYSNKHKEEVLLQHAKILFPQIQFFIVRKDQFTRDVDNKNIDIMVENCYSMIFLNNGSIIDTILESQLSIDQNLQFQQKLYTISYHTYLLNNKINDSLDEYVQNASEDQVNKTIKLIQNAIVQKTGNKQ